MTTTYTAKIGNSFENHAIRVFQTREEASEFCNRHFAETGESAWVSEEAEQQEPVKTFAVPACGETYRIRQAEYVSGFFAGNKDVKIEYVVEKKRARIEGEDDYQYERDCWTRITSGSTEIDAKKWFVRWLQAEIETAETPESEYAD